MAKERKSDAIDELTKILDARYNVAREILHHIEKAREVYERDKTGVNLPRCAREHLDWLARDLKQYVEDIHMVSCRLPRLLSNETEHLD